MKLMGALENPFYFHVNVCCICVIAPTYPHVNYINDLCIYTLILI
jgi:hypothetical protein